MKYLKHLFWLTSLVFGQLAYAQNVVKVHNWLNYIDPAIIEDFTLETGIKVEYSTYVTDLEIEQIFNEKKPADIVVAYHFMLPELIQNKKIKTLNAELLPNRKNLNKDLLLRLQSFDANNKHAIPYLWSILGLSVNTELTKNNLGEQFTNDWGLIFDENKNKKLAECGISVFNAPRELYTVMYDYQGLNLLDSTINRIQSKADKLKQIKSKAKYVDNLAYADDLLNNNLCVAMSYSGHAIPIINANSNVKFYIPDDYGLIALDNMIIPAHAQNVAEAHQFINYLLREDVAAKIVNATKFSSGVNNVKTLVDQDLQQNPLLFPERSSWRNFYLVKEPSHELKEAIYMVWQEVM